MQDAAAEIRAIVAEILEIDRGSVSDGLSLIDDLGADSLDAIEIVMEIEASFAIHLSDREIAEMDTVARLIEVVRSKAPAWAA